jgi:hypothetical protein
MKRLRSIAAPFLFLDCVPRVYWAEVVAERPKRG